MSHPRLSAAGFTLVEVLVALVVVAIGLAALMLAVSGTARTSGYLRDKAIAQWIGLNRLTEVRLNTNKFGTNTDASEVTFANRTWHYDTRYFDTPVHQHEARLRPRVRRRQEGPRAAPCPRSKGISAVH